MTATSGIHRGRRLAFALGIGLAVAAQAAPPKVTIVSPVPAPVYGAVTFEVQASGDLQRVELLVDGKQVAVLRNPPYRAEVDLGDDNLAHRFEARAYGADGEVGEAVLETPVFHVDEEIFAPLQQLYVTVTSGDKRVLDLAESDFTILDNGKEQELVTFGKGEVPLAAMVLIDASTSMAGDRLRSALRGAETFLQAMRPGDETAITLFSDRVLHQSPFSGDSGGLIAGLAGTRASGGTALNDTLYLSLKRLEDQQGRRVLILLSDGVDTHSALTMNEVTWLAQRSRALIYWIRTDPDNDLEVAMSSSWKSPEIYREERKKLLAAVLESGGRMVNLANLADSRTAFAEILAELREQYVLGYYPSESRNDGAWHRIQVKVRRDGLEVRTKNGYLDY